jgi:peptidoglycan-N-acetylglucosamine deacetylase
MSVNGTSKWKPANGQLEDILEKWAVYMLIISVIIGMSLLIFIMVTAQPAHAATGAAGGIALTFDDQYPQDWYTIKPLLDQYNVKATFFVTTPQTLSADDVKKLLALQSDGMEIACHGYNHIDAVDYTRTHSISNYISVEITPAISLLKKLGFKISDFAWPSGSSNSKLDTALLPYFTHLRYTSWAAAGTPLKNINMVFYKFDGSRILYAASTDNNEGFPLQQYKDAIDLALKNKWVLVTFGHQIKETTKKDYITQTSKLKAIIQYAASKGLKFYTISQLN